MKSEKNLIDITPAPKFLDVYGNSNLTFVDAVSELVDNSIDARRDDRLTTINIEIDTSKKRMIIEDDALGMNEDQARSFMKLADSSKSKETMIGFYGVGAKLALMSICNRFKMETTQAGSKNLYWIEFNKKKFIKNKTWAIPLNISSSRIEKSGTRIVIEDIRVPLWPNYVQSLRQSLALRYDAWIENREVLITVNGQAAYHTNPELVLREEIDFKLASGHRITGFRGIMNQSSGPRIFGFHLVRNGRVITSFKNIGFSDIRHHDYSLIFGKLNLDFVPVSTNKSQFLEESAQYKEVMDLKGEFWKYMSEFASKARNALVKSNLDTKLMPDIENMLEEWISKMKINPESNLKRPPGPLSNLKKIKDSTPLIVEIETKSKTQHPPRFDLSDSPDDYSIDRSMDDKKKPKELKKKRLSIVINGVIYDLSVSFRDFGSIKLIKQAFVDKNQIEVLLNENYFSENLRQRKPLIAGSVIEGVVEIQMEKEKFGYPELCRRRDSHIISAINNLMNPKFQSIVS